MSSSPAGLIPFKIRMEDQVDRWQRLQKPLEVITGNLQVCLDLYQPVQLRIAGAVPQAVAELTVGPRLTQWQLQIQELFSRASQSLSDFQGQMLQYNLDASGSDQVVTDRSQLQFCLEQIRQYIDAGHKFLWS